MTNFRFLITIDDLQTHLDEPGWRIMDCRHDLMQPAKGFEEYGQSHIPGAQYANLDKDLAGPVTDSTGRHPLPSPEDFADTLGSWGIDNDTQIVAYDHASGAVAARLWWMMNWIGHERVAVLDGGFNAWQSAGLPLSNGNEPVMPLEYHPYPEPGMIMSTAELQSLIGSNDAPLLVDARDAVRFAGEREPIDAVAGHIPGAINHPFSAAFDENGHWQSAEELGKSWSDILGDRETASWVSMCGSGVTACHLALSAGLAGYPRPRLYVGSWSEWIRDPSRPIATGS
jgi:thiosulfate/3-mercaptopyruvate sulfurtransferase